MIISKKTIILKVSEGVQLFQGGRATFSIGGGGGPMGNFYRNPYNL